MQAGVLNLCKTWGYIHSCRL